MEKSYKDMAYAPQEPPPAYIQQHSVNNSDTIISFPEVIVNPNSGDDGSEPLVEAFTFDDKMIRQGFIRKVYAIILAQLIVTSAIIAWFMNDDTVMTGIRENAGLVMGASFTVYLTTACMIMCCEGPRRKVPWNFIILFIFTLSLSVMVGIICSFYEFQEILIAGGITFAIVFSLTIFAFQTKIDFTMMSGSLLCILLVFTLFGFAMLLSPFPALHLLYTAIGVLVMSLYLVYDTQLMVGGKHRYSISPEEYVFAAMNIYIDIMYIFIRILRLMR